MCGFIITLVDQTTSQVEHERSYAGNLWTNKSQWQYLAV